MHTTRRLTLAATATATLLAAAAAAATPAAAVTPPTLWQTTIATASGTTSAGSAGWDVKTGTVRLGVSTGELAAGSCVTVYFDWASHGHHDSRALRSCKPHDSIAYTFKDDSPTNLINHPSKLGVCYGAADSRGTCVRGAGTHYVTMDWTPWPDITRATPCDLSWARRNATGTLSTYLDPHSRSGGLSAPNKC
jgi:opacity protein-like surface antigen